MVFLLDPYPIYCKHNIHTTGWNAHTLWRKLTVKNKMKILKEVHVPK